MHGYGTSVESKRKIYHIRCREIFLKSNYPAAFNDKKCPAPHSEIDQQIHVYHCPFFIKQNKVISQNLIYKNIFENNV